MKSTITLFFATLFIFSACKKDEPKPPIVEQPNTFTNTLISGNNCTQFYRELSGGELMNFNSIKQSIDGGYLTTGYYNSNGVKKNHIIKMDCFGETTSETIVNTSLKVTISEFVELPNNEYVLLCVINNAFPPAVSLQNYLMKVDANGNEIWGHTIATGTQTFPQKLEQLSNGNFVFAGLDNFSGGYIVETDSNGNVLWSDTFGSDYLFDFTIKPNDHILITGRKNDDIFIAEISGGASGTLVWMTTIDKDNLENTAYQIVFVNNSIFITGSSIVPNSNTSISFLMKLDNSGNEIYYNTAHSGHLTLTHDDQLLISAGSPSSLALTKINTTDGAIIWTANPWPISSGVTDVRLTSDNGFIFLGVIHNSTSPRYSLTKTDEFGN